MDQTPSQPGPWNAGEGWPPTPPPYGVARPHRPRSIRTAVRLMWVGAAISLVGILVTVLGRDEIRDELRDRDSSLTADELDTALNVAVGLAVVIGLVTVGLWLWMASANGQGKSWARTVATVLGGLNVALTVLGLATGQATPVGVVLNVVSLGLALAIIVLLYREDSSRYYEAMSP